MHQYRSLALNADGEERAKTHKCQDGSDKVGNTVKPLPVIHPFRYALLVGRCTPISAGPLRQDSPQQSAHRRPVTDRLGHIFGCRAKGGTQCHSYGNTDAHPAFSTCFTNAFHPLISVPYFSRQTVLALNSSRAKSAPSGFIITPINLRTLRVLYQPFY